jgi:hypothetical protein
MPAYIQHTLTPPQTKQYTLPRHPTTKPFSKPPSKLAPGAATTTTSPTSTTATPSTASTINVKLLSPRNPPFELTLPAQPPNTSLAEIKEQVAHETGLPLAKIKLLHGKKPVGDSKLLRELVAVGGADGVGAGELELGVMVLGGAAGFSLKKKEVVVEEAVKEQEGEGEGDKMQGVEGAVADGAASVAQGLSGEGVLATGEFWEDLRGFLQQRVRDERVAGEALGVFKGAWEGRSA